MSHIFVSYAHNDVRLLKVVHEQLKERDLISGPMRILSRAEIGARRSRT